MNNRLFFNGVYIMIIALCIFFTGCSENKKQTAKKEFLVEEMKISIIKRTEGHYFTIMSNLPDKTEILISLYKNEQELLGQAKGKLQTNTLTLGPFMQGEELLSPGDYLLTVTAPVISHQDESVKQILGEKGEFMKGVGITKALSLGFAVEQKFKISLP